MKIAYFDCFAGAGGDMIAAAMLDAGVDEDFMLARIGSLGLDGVEIHVEKVMRCGVSATYFSPQISGHHRHRSLNEIIRIINCSQISDTAKNNAIAVFDRLGHAEAQVHNKNIEEIHFHEVGASDSIVDIVAACVGMDALGVGQIRCSRLSVGGGTVKCVHGTLPVPAPATANLLSRAGAPIMGGAVDKELLTPTAAAVLTHFAGSYGPIPEMTIEAVGYGAGTLETKGFPNVLRLIIGQAAESDAEVDAVCLLECNVDDATAEVIGFVTDACMQAGALDVYTTSIQMKYNRPAVKVSIICEPLLRGRMEELLLRQGLTFGIRRQLMQRSKLSRKFVTVHTRFGNIHVKMGYYQGKLVTAKPEYADCVAAATKHDASLKTVQDAAMQAFHELQQ